MSARNEDFLFAQEAQNLGYVSEEQIEEGFLLQRKMSEDLEIEERLAVILVKRGWLAEEQARRVYGIIEPEGARSQIEGYRLVEKIGSGAMGTVYKAIHKGLHRVVAIKILRRDLATDKTQIERLKREAKLLADLDHPNVVRAFDAGESNGCPYLVMEYVEGETLRDHIARHGALSNEEALRITRALADALERARRMGVVHRDVKPGNVLMSKGGAPKLMDLGLAKGPLDLGLTQHGATVGTPQFISPEQAQDPRKADTRSDIYSLGAALYAMVTTRPPFEGATLAEIITKVLYQQPAPPRTLNRNISPEVAHLIERMMLKDPSLRYQTPAQVVADIDMIRGGQSIMPKGFTGNWEAYLLRQRQRKWIRRGVIGLAACVALAVGGYTWLSKVQREQAQAELDDLAVQVLQLPGATASSTGADIAGWQAEARRLKAGIDRCERESGVACSDKGRVEERLRIYAETLAALRALQNERDSLEQLREKAQFNRALKRLAMLAERARQYRPTLALHMQLADDLRKASDRHLKARLESARARTARDLDEFVAKWHAYAAAREGDYIQTKTWWEANTRTTTLKTAADRIQSEVREFRAAFSGQALAARIEALDFFDLKKDLRGQRGEVLRAVVGHWEAFRKDAVSVPRALLTGETGFVRGALQDVEDEVDRRVEAFVQHVMAEAPTLDAQDAVARLRELEGQLLRGNYYDELSRRAGELADDIDAERERRQGAAAAAFRAVRAAVLTAIRRGDPQALRRAVDESLARPELDAPRRADVEALRAGADALDELQAAALTHLKVLQSGGKRLSDVRRRAPDGSVVVDRRWSDVEIDEGKGLLRARVQGQGSRRETIVIALRELTLGQLRAWANQSERGLGEFTLALIELGRLDPVHDEPGRDLRTLVEDHRSVLLRFERMDADSAYARLVRQLVANLEELQRSRELDASAALSNAEHFVYKGKYLQGLDYLNLLESKNDKLRFTDVFDSSREKRGVHRKTCEGEIAREALLSLLPGAIPEALDGGRHRFLFDMDDELQLRNFDRGFGRLLEHGSTVTPTGPSERRLVLLHGVEGILRDRPLSIPTMFDPAEKIVLEATIWTLDGSFLVAFDIDGVQLAICSADPNLWKWRFDPRAPTLEEEDVLPEFDFYGRGRGIAFHAGKDFGDAFPLGWDWPAFGHGRHFERWQDEKFMREKRDTLFAFLPGRKHRVKVVRDRGTMQLWVDGEEIVRRRDALWVERGDHSDLDKRVRHGSGRIQILTWTPMGIDNLTLEGRVMDHWRRFQKLRLADMERLQAEEKARREAEKARRGDGK